MPKRGKKRLTAPKAKTKAKAKAKAKAQTLTQTVIEDEERKYRATRDSSKFFDALSELDMRIPSAHPTPDMVSVRIDEPSIEKLKSLAAKQGVEYQTLIRMWVLERLEQEAKR